MGRLATFIMGFFLGGVTVYVSLHYHFVHTNDGLHVVPKLASTFSETYVDVRQFGFAEWNEHRALAGAIIQAKRNELFGGTVAEPFGNAVQNALDVLNGGSP